VTPAAVAAVAALGGAGAVLRVLLSRGRLRGTLLVNLAGALALGALAGADPGADALRLAGAGLLGAATTFSTWMAEARELLEHGRRRAAAGYLVAPLLAGLLAVAAGHAAASSLT